MSSPESLRGHVVIVTGGGSGIGKEAAAQFADRGASVMVVGRTAERLRGLAQRYEAIASVVGDATQEVDARRIVQAAMDRWGRIDILVNNAGMFRGATLADSDVDLVAELLAANVVGPTVMTRASLGALRASRGAVVNISSTYGHRAAVGRGHYGASKAALESLTTTWALELASERIRVNAVAPGPTDTPMLAHAGLSPELIESVVAASVDLVPLGRRAMPSEIAAWIVALGDPAAAWVTGAIIHVDGGLSVA